MADKVTPEHTKKNNHIFWGTSSHCSKAQHLDEPCLGGLRSHKAGPKWPSDWAVWILLEFREIAAQGHEQLQNTGKVQDKQL